MNLLALVESPDHVCCRYRIRQFERSLHQSGWSLTCEALERGTFSRLLQLKSASRFDAVVLQRKLLPAWQLRLLRRSARRLAFDFDDAVLYRDSYDRRGPQSRWRSRRFAQTVKVVDTVIAGNDFLADCALRAGAEVERVNVIPTCVDPGAYPLTRHDASARHLDLVWIGSSSTLRGLEQSRPIWERLRDAIPHLRLRLICDRFPESFPLPIVPIPWSEPTEARDLAAGQIGISWLPDDPWSRGKCGLKLLQYHAAGLPVVANPVGLQCELIRIGETGFLATTPDEWVEAVKTLAGDPRRRLDMGLAARRRVEVDYSTTAWAETVITSMTGSTPAPSRPSWKIDRAAGTIGPLACGPHSITMKPPRKLNHIGER